jgi:hypothetical protein
MGMLVNFIANGMVQILTIVSYPLEITYWHGIGDCIFMFY